MAEVSPSPLLQVADLSIRFPGKTEAEGAEVVADVSFAVAAGETLALVGESGAGKSMTGLALLRLVPYPGVVSGRVLWKEEDLLACSRHRLRQVRGAEIGMIFQEPSAMLNPTFSVGAQVAEVLRCHAGLDRQAARQAALDLLDRVRIHRARERFHDYPHQMSGGMLQRVMIAIAVACGPQLLVADEPTTALDAAVQREIMELLAELQADLGLALLLITHNLGLVAEMADQVLVLRHGRAVEQADVFTLFASPAHPYTRSLLAAAPQPLTGPPADE